MPHIRPSTDLRNSYNDISAFCHKNHEPVFITKNGHGDLAVMSIEAYEQLAGKRELYRLLGEGMEDVRAGRVQSAEAVFAEIEGQFHGE